MRTTSDLSHELWAMAQGIGPIEEVVRPMEAEIDAFVGELRADRDSLRDALAALVNSEDYWQAMEMARHVLGSKRA